MMTVQAVAARNKNMQYRKYDSVVKRLAPECSAICWEAPCIMKMGIFSMSENEIFCIVNSRTGKHPLGIRVRLKAEYILSVYLRVQVHLLLIHYFIAILYNAMIGTHFYDSRKVRVS